MDAKRHTALMAAPPEPSEESRATVLSLINEAIEENRAGTVLRRIRLLYPRVRAPLEAAATQVCLRLSEPQAYKAIDTGIHDLRQGWQPILGLWHDGWIDNHQLLRRALTHYMSPLFRGVAECGIPIAVLPGVLPGLKDSGLERREGQACWKQLRAFHLEHTCPFYGEEEEPEDDHLSQGERG